ncbi:MAG: 2-amino-4-hydroxy-6-hydroxymethyldihydropteridine diphosphokinase [Gammaproteobacteria bacterium]|nr:2-amino-4-hydroxy-6-hydroxymethyldihydropteridine diphosphokinase [Gammaproteobacteria bacterium]
MAQVFIGVGSNIDRDENIRSGIRVLREQFNNVSISTLYETSAVGFEGDNFYNMVVSLETDLQPRELQEKLHDIENQFGRTRGGPRYVSRTLDLDLLLYDDLVCEEEGLQIPREDVTKFAFVLLPLSEMAGELRHPVSEKCYMDIWSDFDQTGQELWVVELEL